MRDITSGFRQEKNKLQSAAFITLYDIVISDALTVRVCDYDKNVVFNGDLYIAYPVKKSEIDQNMLNVITSMTLSIANANRVYGGYLEVYDGLIGNKVTVTSVFTNLLSDPNAKVVEEYYIKSSSANQNAIIFNLVSKLDIMNYEIPRRTFETNFCQWNYKGLGCWEEVDNINWGVELALPSAENHPDYACFIGGGTSLLGISANQYLKSVSYKGYGPSNIRLAIYRGYSGTNPDGAALFYDLGEMGVSDGDKLYTKTIPSALQPLVDPYIYWIAVKTGGITNTWKYTFDNTKNEDFPDAVGLLVNPIMDSTPANAFESVVPTGSNEAVPKEWVSLFMTYGEKEGYVGPQGFIGTAYSCDHTLDGVSGCEWHLNEKRFGGFFSIPQDIRILRI